MNENVKYFIEDNINLIDKNDWEEFFKNSQDPNEGLTDESFSECLTVLQSIGITFTPIQLKDLFIKVMKWLIEGYFEYHDSESEDIYWFLTHVPNNLFDYRVEYAQNIIENNTEELGIELIDTYEGFRLKLVK